MISNPISHNTIEKLFIIIIFLYTLFVGIYFLYLRKRPKKGIVGKSSSINKISQLKTNIVGESKFNLSRSKQLTAKSEPLITTPPESETRQENPNIFASLNELKSSAEVPQEELDEAFSNTQSDQDNKPMDIDYPLEYETEEEYEETEQVEGMSGAALASGVQFEDLGNAIRTVNKTDQATSEQKQKAGNTLLEIRKTDMFEQIVSSKPDAKKIVTDLMTESLADFHRRKNRKVGTEENEKKAPDSFNIRDFA